MTHKLHNYTSGDNIMVFRPIIPKIKSEDIIGKLSINGSYEYRWNTDCLSVNQNEKQINIKYHTWHHRDKYNEGLKNTFTISIDSKNITIEIEKVKYLDNRDHETKFTLQKKWLFSEINSDMDIPQKPQILNSLFFDHFTYDHMDLGTNIYLALCQIYKNKFELNIKQQIIDDDEIIII